MLTVFVLAATLDTFNNALIDATRRLDNAAVLALWEENGVSLLPATEPIVGKPAIAKFLTGVSASLRGAHMETFTLQCSEQTISGDWASEWCIEHQVVTFYDGRKPFDGVGKLLFVLHRGRDRKWRLKTEMWNQGAPIR